MSPDEGMSFAGDLETRAQGNGMDIGSRLGALGGGGGGLASLAAHNARLLAGLVGQMHQAAVALTGVRSSRA